LSEGTSESVGGRETLQAWVALVTVVLWASAFVGIRAAGKDLSPGALSLGRLLVGSAALGAFVVFRRELFPARRDLPAIALCGVLWFGLYNVVLNAAERLVEAGTAAMLVGVGPSVGVRRRVPELPRTGPRRLGTRLLRDQLRPAGTRQGKIRPG
jgi:EamA-like transporter family